MTETEFRKFLAHGESTWLDWKADFPRGLLDSRKDPDWDRGKAEVIKDLSAIANGDDEKETGYLIYGVKDSGADRHICGTSKSFNDADFQTWAGNSLDPPPRFTYVELKEGSTQKTVGIFEILRVPEYPHVVCANVGGVIFRGQVWYRVGTQNQIALHTELGRMFRGPEPFKINSMGDQVFTDIVCPRYKQQGEEVVLPLMAEKDAKLVSGFRIAHYPGTRREIWVGFHNGQYGHIAMLKPR
ncbi:MAG: ATP-binding protein [Planctomycetota bacterium]